MKKWLEKKWNAFLAAEFRLQVMLVLFGMVLLMMLGAALAVCNA